MMTNVAKINTQYRDNTITDTEDYVKYEIYIPKKFEPDFEAWVSNKEFWTWLSKTEVKVH